MCLNIYGKYRSWETAMRIIYLREQETTGTGKFIKRAGLNLPYCSNCPKPLNHAYGRLQMSYCIREQRRQRLAAHTQSKQVFRFEFNGLILLKILTNRETLIILCGSVRLSRSHGFWHEHIGQSYDPTNNNNNRRMRKLHIPHFRRDCEIFFFFFFFFKTSRFDTCLPASML